jgi:hypothetical protein
VDPPVKVKEDLDCDMTLTSSNSIVDPKQECVLDIDSMVDMIDEEDMQQDVYMEQLAVNVAAAIVDESQISEDENEEEHIIIEEGDIHSLVKEQDFDEENLMVDEKDDGISVVEYAEFDDAMDDDCEVEYLDIAWDDDDEQQHISDPDQKPNILALSSSAVQPQFRRPKIKREPGAPTSMRRNKRSICNICGHAVDGQKKLERHMGTHAPGYKGKRVAVKKESFSDFDDAGMKQLKRPKKYTCPVCNHDIDSPSKLKTHMAKHMQLRRQGMIKLEEPGAVEEFPVEYICSFCSCMFPDSDCLMFHEEQHQKAHTQRQKKSHLCELCGVDLPNRSLYSAHMLRHTGNLFIIIFFCA